MGSEEKKLKLDLQVLLDKEELWWKQRAKEEWLKFGDRNTKYYHACANSKRRQNYVGMIRDERGQEWDTAEGVTEAFVHYFTRLFSKGPEGDLNPCIQPLECCVSAAMNAELVKPFLAEEITTTLFQMGPLKAPGSNGLNECFFQKNWSLMGKEVCDVVIEILNSGFLPHDLNLTYIALIPKTQSLMNVTEFRPISLCNGLYKIISKVLANHLKKILHLIISPTQSAFIPGHLISDNVLAAYEILHTMHIGMWEKKGFMPVKLDMSKVYDRVEWGFLEAVMRWMGFNERWISLVLMCVKSVCYLILVNGNPCGFIVPSRGIRQGDPLSPYLSSFAQRR